MLYLSMTVLVRSQSFISNWQLKIIEVYRRQQCLYTAAIHDVVDASARHVEEFERDLSILAASLG